MESGGQPGNDNARKGREWRNAINRALEKRGNGDRTKALDELAEKFIAAAVEMTASTDKRGPSVQGFVELGDRLDGKPKNETELTGDLRLHGLAEVIGGIGQGAGEHNPVAK